MSINRLIIKLYYTRIIKNKLDGFILVKIIITKIFGCIEDKFQNIVCLFVCFGMHVYMSRILLGRNLRKLLTEITPGEGVTGHQGGRSVGKTLHCIPSFSLSFDLF